MPFYIARRMLLMIPTLFGILALSFLIVQFAPGGPVERVLAQIAGPGSGGDLTFQRRRQARSPPGGGGAAQQFSGKYRGAQGLDPKFIAELEKQFGFDKPPLERFWLMIRNYAMFNFGRSYFRDDAGAQADQGKSCRSPMSLGLWMTFLSYIISIPLGIAQGAARGRGLRHLDFGGHHHRLRYSELPLRHPADRAVCRRLVLADFPAARPQLRRFSPISLLGKIKRLSLAHRAAGLGPDARRLRHHDLPDQERLHRRNPKAICTSPRG